MQSVLHLGSPLVWLPLTAAVLFSWGAIFLKRAAAWQTDSWRVTFIANQISAVTFLPLILFSDASIALDRLWQPAFVGLLYLTGQLTTMLALTRGEVSVAAPVLGLKIVMVAVISTILLGRPLPAEIWISCGLATLGVALLNVSKSHGGRDALYSATMAFLSAMAFALFDVCVQMFSKDWGIGTFLPIVFVVASLLSFGLVPLFNAPLRAIPREARSWLLVGCMLIALQALCIVSTIATWGHAAAANVVYSTRGVWSIFFVWLLGHRVGKIDNVVGGTTMVFRFIGAVILLAAITLLLV